jgi:hypothetical protein
MSWLRAGFEPFGVWKTLAHEPRIPEVLPKWIRIYFSWRSFAEELRPQQRQPHTKRLKSGAIELRGVTAFIRAEIFALPAYCPICHLSFVSMLSAASPT